MTGTAIATSDTTPVLTPEGLLLSDLWIDRPDALEELEQRRQQGRLSDREAENLAHFISDGYCVLDLELRDELFEDIDRTVDRLWQERPKDLAVAYRGLLKPMSDADPERDRRPSCRIADLHSHCPTTLALYLNRTIFRYLRLIFERPPVATQSLYFEWGSQQQLHRDPVHVVMKPPSHLAAAWIALEDLEPGCGPLTYVAGSHRLPYYQIEPGEYRFDHYKHTDEDAEAMSRWDLENCERHGLKVEPFLARRGQVLLWHHSLLHGGSYPEDPNLTRKSFVVHYTTMDNYERAAQTVVLRDAPGAEPTPHQIASFRVLGRDGCYGFASPLAMGSSA